MGEVRSVVVAVTRSYNLENHIHAQPTNHMHVHNPEIHIHMYNLDIPMHSHNPERYQAAPSCYDLTTPCTGADLFPIAAKRRFHPGGSRALTT